MAPPETGASHTVYKICPRAAWDNSCRTGHYRGSSDDLRDGFIHLSAAHQITATAAKYFRGRPDLVLVAMAAAALGPGLVWEPSRGGELFPHHYGPLPVSAALAVIPLPLGSDGVPLVPETLR
ncbi:MAG: DUF952 domain-containing protein [Hyphomicrobium sp.]